MYDGLSDAELVYQCLEGDRSAFECIITRYQGKLYRIAFNQLLNWADAEEVTQDALVKAYTRLGQLKEHRSLYAWLVRITLRCAHDYQRQRKRSSTMTRDLPGIPESVPLQERCIRKMDIDKLVSEALRRLPEKYRLPLLLHYIDEATYPEIAQTLGISPSGAETRVRRGRDWLREHLRRTGLEDACHEALRIYGLNHPIPADLIASVMECVQPLPTPTPPPATPISHWVPYLLAGGITAVSLLTGSGYLLRGNPADVQPSGHVEAIMLEQSDSPMRLEVKQEGRLRTARFGLRTVSLPNGRLLVSKGTGESNHHLADAELHEPETGKIKVVSGSEQAHGMGFTATVLKDDRVLLAGGRLESTYSAEAEVYDPERQTFTTVGRLTCLRAEHTATLLVNEQVLIIGGASVGNSQAHDSAEIYDPSSRSFARLSARMSFGRQMHMAVRLHDGRVLIIGGVSGTGGDYAGPALSDAEIYDPETQQFYLTGSMHLERHNFTATLLKDGRVLVVGGSSSSITGGAIRATAELYDPATGQFHLIATMSEPREGHAATLLPDGSVLIIGGYHSDSHGTHYVRNIERFDPTTHLFVPVGELHHPRSAHTATLTDQGDVLVVGGLSPEGTPVGVCERLRTNPDPCSFAVRDRRQQFQVTRR